MPTIALLKVPYEISFAGNPMPFIFQIVPYGDREQSHDINLTVRVLVETISDSGLFDEVYIQKLYPKGNGQVEIDVSGIISPYLDYYTPRTDLTVPVECTSHRKRYKISYLLQNASLPVVPWDGGPIPIGQLSDGGFTESDTLYAIKGGLSFEAWHYKEFFTKIILEDKMPLLFTVPKELVDPAALKFLYWIYPFDDAAVQTVTYKVYLSDGTNVSLANTATLSSAKWSVNCVPVGFLQSGLDAIYASVKSPVKYSVTITTDANTIVEEYFFTLDNRNFYDPYFIIYRTSTGGLETIRLTGEIDLAADYAAQQAQRTVPPAWYNPNLVGQIKDEATEETMNYTADTGFMSKQGEMKLRDLLLSKEKYMICNPELVEGTGVRLLPIALTAKNVKFYSNKDSNVSASITWQLAFINTFYTPADLMPQTRTCPAIEKFYASQLTKNLLQFVWSLEDPYTLLEVQVTINDVTSIYTYKGNTGMISQFFDNPVTDTPIDITIQARTICNPDSVPVDYGAFSTITLSIIGDSLPVAVDDYFSVPTGTSVPFAIPISALANDYDPDGDPIEAVPDWGLTDNASVWTMDINGFITFQNNNPAYSGLQTFVYHIRNVGGSILVAGNVYITVGNGPQRIFVKWVFRNVTSIDNDGTQVRHGEAWLDFYSDPACTIPIDITAFGIPIQAHLKETEKKVDNSDTLTITDTDYNVYGKGTKMLMYTGELYWHDYKHPVPPYFEERIKYRYYDFTVLDGIGYTAVN